METTVAENLITAVRAALHKEYVDVQVTEQLVALSKQHQVHNLVYFATQAKELEQSVHLSIAQSMVQQHAAEELMQYFEEHGIYVTPVKGTCTKQRYQDPVYRTMGDIDILIRPEQNDAVKAAMEALGYSSFSEGRKHDHYSRPPYVAVEVHRALVDGGSKYYSYYENIWERCSPPQKKASNMSARCRWRMSIFSIWCI